MSERARGLAITTLAMLVITPDVLLIRLVDTDPWTLAFWRGLLSAAGLVIGLIAIYRRRTLKVMLAPGVPGLVIGTLFGIGTIAFVWAITHTSAASTLLIIATGSMFGAAFSWLLMRERLPVYTIVAMTGTFAGLLIIVSGEAGTSSSLEGDLSALVVAVLSGLTFALIRKHRMTDMVPTLAIGGLVTAAIALAVSLPAAVGTGDARLIAVMGLVMLPLAFSLQFVGARYIPAPEVLLLFLLEAVLAPLLLWAAIGETPTGTTIIGGLVILATLASHAVWSLRHQTG
ncbi:MAG: DMT family transporter [Alphaproteobacteria bacterium]|nr:DMT family transporter [Alphaproteobacteria bacterium]